MKKEIKADTTWIFGYGSLMWDPGFDFECRLAATAHGWHRKFGFLSTVNWGTLRHPGAVAALYRGGACAGVAIEVSRNDINKVIRRLDRREAAYNRRKVHVILDDGFEIGAITYVATWNRLKFQRRDAMDHIHNTKGRSGSSLEYLNRVVDTLDAFGQMNSDAHRLLEKIRGQ